MLQVSPPVYKPEPEIRNPVIQMLRHAGLIIVSGHALAYNCNFVITNIDTGKEDYCKSEKDYCKRLFFKKKNKL